MMMRPGKSAFAFALISVVMLGAGCRQTSSHLRAPRLTGNAASHATDSNVSLAGFSQQPASAPQEGPPKPPLPSEDAKQTEEKLTDSEPPPPVQPSAEKMPTASQSATPAARTEPNHSTTASADYTAPGAAYQQLAIATAAAAVGVVPSAGGAGKEAAESLVFSPRGTSGRLGLVTTATTSDGSIVSSSGLGEGAASRIGSASPNNIFTAQVNRVSGPTGRCRELTNAGHFGGSRPQCAVSFRGRR